MILDEQGFRDAYLLNIIFKITPLLISLILITNIALSLTNLRLIYLGVAVWKTVNILS